MSAAPQPATSRLQLALITVSVMFASLMQALDMTVANVALPHMQGALSASQEQISWVLTSYTVATAISLPFSGWLAERYGRSNVMLWAVAGFTTASAFCGAAESLNQIIIGRVLQGALGASLIPLSQAVIIQNYPAHRVRLGIAIWSSGTMIAPILGPTLGGLVTDTIGWRWVFYINVPFGILAILGMLSYLPKNPPNPLRRLDFFGFATLTLAIGLFQAVLDRGQLLDWFDSNEIRLEACVALVAFAFFITHTLTTRSASFFDRHLLADSNYFACLVGMGIGGGILSATRALFPLMLQGLFFYSAFSTGLILSPSGLGAVIAIVTYGRWANRLDNRIFVGSGLFLVGLSLWNMIGFNLEAGYSAIAWPNFIQGAGMILFMTPLSALAFSTLPQRLLNEGATIFYLARNIGGSVAISITQALISRNASVMHASLADHVSPYSAFALPPYVPPALDMHSDLGLALLNEEVTRQATMTAYLDAFSLLLFAALAATPLLLLIRVPRHGKLTPTNLVTE